MMLESSKDVDSSRIGVHREHVFAFDLARNLAVAMVIGVHVLSVAGGQVTVSTGAFLTVFHSSREVFFLITAFVLTYTYGRRRVRWLSFWKKRYACIVPAYLVWSAIYFLANGNSLDPASRAAAEFGWDLLRGTAQYHLYFLLVSMQIYLLFPLLRLLLKKTEGHHGSLLLGVVGYQVLITVAIHHQLVATGVLGWWFHNPNALIPSYMLYVVAGGLAAWHFDRFISFTRDHLGLVLTSFVVAVSIGIGVYLAAVFAWHETPSRASAVFQPIVVAESLAIAWALFGLGVLWSDDGSAHRRVVSGGADASFGIFLSHPLLLQGLIAVGSATGLLATVRRAPAPIEMAILLLLVVPLIYGTCGLCVVAVRRTVLSLPLTGRPRLKNGSSGSHSGVSQSSERRSRWNAHIVRLGSLCSSQEH